MASTSNGWSPSPTPTISAGSNEKEPANARHWRASEDCEGGAGGSARFRHSDQGARMRVHSLQK
jgi:hypothetical protein